MFDFNRVLAESKAATKNKSLFAIVMGASGGGKSFLMGTLGVKTLYLYISGEAHGAESAAITGGDLVHPYCLDYVDGKQLSADDTYKHLRAVLQNVEAIKAAGFKAVAIDGAAELELIIRNSKDWAKRCLNEKGIHSNWEESDATMDLLRFVVEDAKGLQRQLGCHIVMTSILDVRAVGDNGEIMDASPRLRGARVADFLLRQFDEVLVVGRLQSAEGQVGHRIQFLTRMSKTAKEMSGGIKLLNFAPRITGVKAEDLPSIVAADLSIIAAAKAAGSFEGL